MELWRTRRWLGQKVEQEVGLFCDPFSKSRCWQHKVRVKAVRLSLWQNRDDKYRCGSADLDVFTDHTAPDADTIVFFCVKSLLRRRFLSSCHGALNFT